MEKVPRLLLDIVCVSIVVYVIVAVSISQNDRIEANDGSSAVGGSGGSLPETPAIYFVWSPGKASSCDGGVMMEPPGGISSSMSEFIYQDSETGKEYTKGWNDSGLYVCQETDNSKRCAKYANTVTDQVPARCADYFDIH